MQRICESSHQSEQAHGCGEKGLVVVYLVIQPRGVLPIRTQETSEPRAHSLSELLVLCDQALPVTILSAP